MKVQGIILLGLIALALARTAPNADYVKELLQSQPASRVSTDIEKDSQLDVVSLYVHRSTFRISHALIFLTLKYFIYLHIRLKYIGRSILNSHILLIVQ